MWCFSNSGSLSADYLDMKSICLNKEKKFCPISRLTVLRLLFTDWSISIFCGQGPDINFEDFDCIQIFKMAQKPLNSMQKKIKQIRLGGSCCWLVSWEHVILSFACRQVSVGENCYRYSLVFAPLVGSILVTFVAVFRLLRRTGSGCGHVFSSAWTLGTGKKFGILDLAPKKFPSMLPQGGLGDAEAAPELVLTKKNGFIWLVLNSFCHVAAHSAQVSQRFRLNGRSRCDRIPADEATDIRQRALEQSGEQLKDQRESVQWICRKESNEVIHRWVYIPLDVILL